MIDEIFDPELEKWLGKHVEVLIEVVCLDGDKKSLTISGVLKREPFGYLIEDDAGAEYLIDSEIIVKIKEI
ncbi:MAG: hypothetical protein OCU18_05395 [Candidatus Syntrophoarchaeum sp.]|nr:hypothetical protein [Candidatus Syntrophoarchaeum sp.]